MGNPQRDRRGGRVGALTPTGWRPPGKLVLVHDTPIVTIAMHVCVIALVLYVRLHYCSIGCPCTVEMYE